MQRGSLATLKPESATGEFSKFRVVTSIGSDHIDRGLAIYTYEDDPNNPHWYQGPGTESFRAPEIAQFVDQQTLQPVGERISSCTNVWGVGIILYCLMTNIVYPDQPNWYGDPSNEDMYLPANNPQHAHYSQHLLQLLTDCLEGNAAVRQSPAQLLTYIRTSLNNNGAVTHLGMMDGTANQGVVSANELQHLPPDSYRLGAAMMGLPPRKGV